MYKAEGKGWDTKGGLNDTGKKMRTGALEGREREKNKKVKSYNWKIETNSIGKENKRVT